MTDPRAGTLERFYEVVTDEGLHSTVPRARFFLSALLDGIPLDGARVLDVGGGRGLLSFYAGVLGAREAVCLEPMADGSTEAAAGEFDDIRERLELDSVTLLRTPLQEFEHPHDFDVVLMHNSVNHLDEEACIHLGDRTDARATYREIFRRLADIMVAGGHLVIADCARSNLFPRFGLRNPLVPTIEWHKHQDPEVWIELLQECGFGRPEVSWSTFNALGDPGRALLGNRLVSFFLTSHFHLRMRRCP